MKEIKSGEWPDWCEAVTVDLAGREVAIEFADQGVGEVQLTEAQPFVAIEYDELGPAIAFTIKYGDGVLPRRHVVAEPRDVQVQVDSEGNIEHVTIEDSTGRRTLMRLS